MFKRFSILLVSIVLLIAGALLIPIPKDNFEAYLIKFNFSHAAMGYDVEFDINTDGTIISKNNNPSDKQSKVLGKVDKKELNSLVKFMVYEKDFYKIPSEIGCDPKEMPDQASQKLAINLNGKKHSVGGYALDASNSTYKNSYGEILQKIDKVISKNSTETQQ